MTTIDLKGRAAIVTGGGEGLGLAAARRLLASGAMVEIWDRDAGRLERVRATLGQSGACGTTKVDVADEGDVMAAADGALARLGRIDILINCAGVVGPIGPTEGYALADWKAVLDVNLTGVFLCSRAVVPAMKARAYGRILNVASMAGKEGNPGQPAYSAAKAGVIALTKVMARELVSAGVTVNAVAPATFDTQLVRKAAESAPEAVAEGVRRIPMGRLGDPEEFAALAAWVVSEECSFTTGFTFDLSGGRAVY